MTATLAIPARTPLTVVVTQPFPTFAAAFLDARPAPEAGVHRAA